MVRQGELGRVCFLFCVTCEAALQRLPLKVRKLFLLLSCAAVVVAIGLYQVGLRWQDFWQLEELALRLTTFAHYPEGSAHKDKT